LPGKSKPKDTKSWLNTLACPLKEPRIASRSENSSRPTRTAPIAAMQKVKWHSLLQTPHFVVYMDAKDPTPSQELHSREALAPVFADLNQYAATMHFLGQSTIVTLNRDRGTGETYCMPHHLTIDGKNRRLMIAALRYTDTFVKMDGTWLFAERKLYVDWLEQRELS
jgi:SnoaL-like domain